MTRTEPLKAFQNQMEVALTSALTATAPQARAMLVHLASASLALMASSKRYVRQQARGSSHLTIVSPFVASRLLRCLHTESQIVSPAFLVILHRFLASMAFQGFNLSYVVCKGNGLPLTILASAASRQGPQSLHPHSQQQVSLPRLLLLQLQVL